MMKTKRLVLGLCLIIGILGSCNDDYSKVGTSIQDDEDKITVYVDSFLFESSTVLMNAVYARTDSALLGEIYDPVYGTLKSDYLCQFYCPENFKFSKTPIDGKIDSVEFRVIYGESVGDTLAPMKAEIFLVNKPLDKNFYTDINPAEYSDMSNSLGYKTYTAYDLSIPDSIRYVKNQEGYYTFVPNVTIKMPKEFGQKIYDETINNPGTFANQDTFNEFFPGLYVTTTFGSGNILGIKGSFIDIYYKYEAKSHLTGNDTIYKRVEEFNVTKEVIQLNRFKNTDLQALTEPNEEYTYIKSPAGVCTRITIPVKEMRKVVEERTLNNMPLTLYPLPQEEYQFALKQPESLLLLPEDSVKTFFENDQIENQITSYVATFSNITNSYSFGNISKLLKDQIDKQSDQEVVNLLVIPVNRKTAYNSYYGTTYTTAITNYFFPAGLKLRKDKEKRAMVITSSKYGISK